ncbi:methyl-accepting chemotaxis protein [Vibrio crassostreae]|uniref:methyl-accepting chemotaxis protein n=1 Tax=Vibrio crassostreae TaxID=246167 RepID=UPI000F4701FE|nr:methyl-accepting chemotaxis protein [Vibrio crassostreae]NOH77236.1 methyl-accepting chemotaxis protein [Vibrio crassostreae]ROR19599.1 methyl-accepting chemotaxis protein [Vibrio crassostreae]CAK1893824.1 methyl-accepting chemotaxis protein [Vibrio crassostreae]CAK2286024.1 methyl-accepting chemotaxis protein [Vibrio crassostreae]CAK2316023.1 methyl-accepting chemotaxis protein [Vibrio crassostreae]
MRHLSIALKIKLGYAICLLFFVISGLVSYKGIQTLSNGFSQYSELSHKATLSGNIQVHFLQMRLASERYLESLDDQYEANYQSSKLAIDELLNNLIQTTTNTDSLSSLQLVQDSVAAFDAAYSSMKQSQLLIDQLVNVEMVTRETNALKAAQSLLYESYNNNDPNASLYAGMLMENFLAAKITVLSYSNNNDLKTYEAGKDIFEYALPGIEGDIESLKSSPYQSELIEDFSNQREAYAKGFEQVHQQMIENTQRTATLASIGDSLAIAVADAQSILEQQKQALTPVLQASEKRSIQIIILLTGVALVIGMTSAVLVTRSITKGIAQVKQITNELSQGNLNVEVNIESKNEIGELLTNMEITIESLRDIVGQVNRSSVRIGEMSESLNQVTNNSSTNATQLNSEMMNISSAVDQLASSTSEIASSANHASQVANQATENVAMGLKEVDKTLYEIGSADESMQVSSQKVTDLHKESMNIGAILEVIKGVSEQTNLLALNAAIEAARAGEQGRGFAVVADEVRTLAKRTQDSASQIDELITSLQRGAKDALESIKESHSTVSDASTQAQQASQNLHVINQHIQDLNQANSQIAVSVDEQDRLTKSLGENAQGANTIAQSNQESVSSISGAASDLTEVAHHLESQVNRFRT